MAVTSASLMEISASECGSGALAALRDASMDNDDDKAAAADVDPDASIMMPSKLHPSRSPQVEIRALR